MPLQAQDEKNIQIPPELTEVWEPEARMVTPGTAAAPPSDAIVLFDGNNLEEWLSAQDDSPARWTINADGSMTVAPGAGDIKTRRLFGDVQLHLEFRTPTVITGDGQGRGNSGVFFQERYEVQVLDNYNNRTYSNGQAGSIYKQYIPLVNVCRPPGEWQTYDIIYTAPRFNKDGIRIQAGTLTVIQNGVLVQNHSEIKGTTEYIGWPQNLAHGPAALKLQDHGNLVSYRNIWIREL
ncbi:MAG: DUF1080 domain-containing protein [Lewinellaceae bacterium]|nr:DUF1080 domain-containing protein [Lewinellaceae bacterium]